MHSNTVHTAPNLLEENIMRSVVRPCCFVHSKQDTSPASLRGDITVRHIVHYVGTQQNQKWANDNILHTHPKTDGDEEMEWESAWHRLRSASQSNYSLILWKLPKCWPLGKPHGLQSHCIECVLWLLLHPALRLAGGLWKRPVCLHCYFQLLLLVADVSHLCGLNLSDKGGASLPPRGHRLFMYQIYFCCHGLPGFTSHLLGWWKVGWGGDAAL